METMTRRKRKRNLLPVVLAVVLAVIVAALALLVFRSLLPAAQREEPDPHAGQIYVNDGANMVWLTPHENFAVSPLHRWQFVTLEGQPWYVGSEFAVRRGVDLSVFQKNVDWAKAAESGVEFAVIRLGFRGYGKGALQPDDLFDSHLDGAHAAGIDAGVYFFSQALTAGDPEQARKVAPLDAEIDQKERNIESMCLKMLLQQQPVARDLRQISAALKMITDMERIGDQAEDIAEIVCFLNGRGSEDDELMAEMAAAAIKMVTESVDAYVKHDILLAEKVVGDDDTVDHYFDQVKNRLIEKIAQDPGDGEYALDLLMIAKYLERIGDHAVNIAQWVIFSVTGTHKED